MGDSVSSPEFDNEHDVRRILSQSVTLVQQHHVCPIDVVHLIGVHRHQNTSDVSLEKNISKKF